MKTANEVDAGKKKEGAISVEEQNKKLVRYAVQEVWNEGNYSVLDEIVSDDFIIHSLDPRNEVHG